MSSSNKYSPEVRERVVRMQDAARDFHAHFTTAAFGAVATASIVRVRRFHCEKMV